MAQKARWFGIGKRLAPPRFVLFALLFLALLPIGVTHHGWAHGVMLSFDVAAAVFLASLWPLLKSDPDDIRHHAAANDANRTLLLGVTGIVTSVILVAVASELMGKPDPLAIALVIATLALAWLFSNSVYALHYAHLFYGDDDADGKDNGGLDVPGTEEPDYGDFLYFAYTLGMTFQTSDVQVTSRSIRRVALLHSLAAFVFNLGVVAFTVNVLGN
ncbi:DUF1345 domain-containing protein [Sphingomonas sp. SUN019]|uniref:DUF1345 domain-containing protein n=1 Tax=Sphingomonas sp. SUN019 TaxID=2937788 RepID=UPI002164266E|nr:DUF1345 domain-containing protein [Sphingomonas sp. SUN019]UVO51265.1 DUF1345 domain-containing protein [Sphingomonas sp. SUN019]